MTTIADPGPPAGATEAAAPPAAGRSPLRTAVQLLGFVMGLALLWWCGSKAFAPENRAQLGKLGEATVGQVAGLMALSALSLALNGTVFWLAIRPVRRLRFVDVQAANAIATLLALLPFKLSMLFRVVVHKVRDGVPVLTSGAWLAAAAALIAGGLAPFIAAGAWRNHAGAGVDALWWAAAIGGLVAVGTGLVVAGQVFKTERGWGVVEGVASKLPGRKLHAVLLPRAHEGVRMLADPVTVYGSMACRAGDIAVQTARFLLAAQILGVQLTLNEAILGACAYFLIGAAAPTGSLGFREEGAAGVLGLLVQTQPPRVLILLITATDTLVVLALAVAGGAWLRVDRLFLARRNGQSAAAP